MRAPTNAHRMRHAIGQNWPVVLAVLPGVALAMAHSTMLVLPKADFIDALDTDRYRIHWITGSYQLGSAIGMAMTRFVGSRMGLRRAYLLAAVLFSLAGAACGLVNEIIWMAPLRLVQGWGNGLLISSAMVIVWRAFPRHRELAMSVYGMAMFVPAVAGVVIGGLLTTLVSWQLIFLVNLPLGIIVFALAAGLLPPEPRPDARVPLDVVGITLLGCTVVTLNMVLDYGQYWGWVTSPHFSIWMVGLIAALGGLFAWGIWGRGAFVNFRVLARRNIGLGILIKVLFSINLYALFALLADYMVNLRGYQWWQAAVAVFPAVVTMIASILFGISLCERANRGRMVIGIAVMALSTWQLTVLDVYTSKFWIAGVLAVWGLGAGLVIGPALTTIFGGLTLDATMSLAGVFNICRFLPSLGAAMILTTLWTQSTDARFDTLRQNVRYNRPVVSQSYQDATIRFVSRGSAHEEAMDQSHALVAQWTHANARAFALDEVLRELALVTSLALVAVLSISRRPFGVRYCAL